jgi:tetratricopeptide (TPR) repeat protein
MAKKKVTRKQLLKQPDEFLSLSARLLGFGVKYKNQVTWACIGLLVLVVAVAGIRYYAAKTESRSFTLLSQAVMKFASLSKEKGPAAAYLEVEGDFNSLIKKFSGTAGGRIARIIYADLSLQGGYPDTAIPLYKQALEDFADRPMIKNGLYLSLAYALEEKKEYAAAADYLETLAAMPDAVGAGQARYNLGRIYALRGDAQKSRQSYEKLLADYPDFIYADLVRSKLAG